jgi:hypothetical protein
VLIQVIQSLIDGEAQSSDEGTYDRLTEEGWRVDNFDDSNNPIFGAVSQKSLNETPLTDREHYGSVGEMPGTKRPKKISKSAWRKDNPGFKISDLKKAKAEKKPMSQTIITAAFNPKEEKYLSSIAYGWCQAQNGEPTLYEFTYTTGGVSETFLSAVEKWNQQKTQRKNLT